MAVPWELCPCFSTKEISPNYFPCAIKTISGLCLPAGSTSWFATSSFRGSSQKNGGLKKKSPQEEDGTCVPKISGFTETQGGAHREEDPPSLGSSLYL